VKTWFTYAFPNVRAWFGAIRLARIRALWFRYALAARAFYVPLRDVQLRWKEIVLAFLTFTSFPRAIARLRSFGFLRTLAALASLGMVVILGLVTFWAVSLVSQGRGLQREVMSIQSRFQDPESFIRTLQTPTQVEGAPSHNVPALAMNIEAFSSELRSLEIRLAHFQRNLHRAGPLLLLAEHFPYVGPYLVSGQDLLVRTRASIQTAQLVIAVFQPVLQLVVEDGDLLANAAQISVILDDEKLQLQEARTILYTWCLCMVRGRQYRPRCHCCRAGTWI
jgi:hypothetical protein